MIKCPYCTKRGQKRLKGYCSKAHQQLDKKPLSKKGHSKAEDHYKFKDGSYIDPAGYRLILVNGKYKKEHRVIWEQANKACLLTNGKIHHIRLDLPNPKSYNHPDNLLLLSLAEHSRFHRLFQTGKHIAAFALLIERAEEQLYYPKELDTFMMSHKAKNKTTSS